MESNNCGKRKYTRIAPSLWAEICALWETGDVTLAELSDRYAVSERALQLHFAKHNVVKGSKAAALAAAVKEEVFAKELDEPGVLAERAKDIRETAYANAVVIETLIMAQLQAAQKDPSQSLRIASNLKALALAASGLERLHDLKRNALGLDNDSLLSDEIPELIVRDLTADEIEEIKASQERDEDGLDELGMAEEAPCPHSTLVPADERAEDYQDDDEVVVEDEDRVELISPRVPVDTDGYRYVRGAKS